jgi:putative protease
LKITAPINKVTETKALIEAGADELYCGVYHDKWYSIEGRPNAKPSSRSSLKSFAELQEIIKISGTYNIPVFITLNAAYNQKQSFELIKEDLKKAVDCNVSGFVVASIPLLREIRKISKDKPLILSTMANCFNSEAVSYYKDLGVSRIVLPRDLTISELANLRDELKAKKIDMPLESFVLNLTCRNVNGYCRYHGNKYHPASKVLSVRILRKIRGLLAYSPPKFYLNKISVIFKKYRDYNEKIQPCLLKYKANFISCKDKSKEKVFPFWIGEPYQAICAACSIFYLREFGIEYLKIIGRWLPTKVKIQDLTFISSLRNILNERSMDFDEFFKKGQENYRKTYGRNCKLSECHYASFIQNKLNPDNER